MNYSLSNGDTTSELYPSHNPDPTPASEENEQSPSSEKPNFEPRQRVENDAGTTRNLNAADVFTTHLYSASSNFVYRKIPIHVHYNISRGSAIVSGQLVDGSSVGDSPIIIPSEDRSIYDARVYLVSCLKTNPVLEAKARRLCDHFGVDLSTLIYDGPPRVIWMDPEIESTWREYGDRHTYPILKALFAQQSFVILWEKEGCGIVNGCLDLNFLDRLVELEALAKTAIVVPAGLLVAAPHRLFLSLALLAIAIALALLSMILDDRSSFIERFESGVFVLGFILLTVPAALSLLTAEPNLLRNAVRGKRILTNQSQVTRFFKLSRRDYAMLVTRTRGSKLVSHEVGCFLTGEERGTHLGDEPVVQCEDLAPFGVICGQSVYYRTNWQTVLISNRLGLHQAHLTREVPQVRYWCAGVRHDTWVGFSS